MTIEQFDKEKFVSGSKVLFDGEEYDIAAISFEEKLIGIMFDDDDDEIYWKRCENVELVP